jgi:CzcA family heavy metal efflux pump
LSRISPAAWALLGAVACALGLWFGIALPTALYPELEYPRVVVVASALGQPAETIDVTVTRPIEEVASAVPGVQRVRGRSIRSAAEVSIFFTPGTDVEVGFQRINSQLAALRGELPTGTSVQAERITAASLPVVSLAVVGGESSASLKDYVLYQLRPRLAQLPGIGRVKIDGGDDREIEIEADPARLAEARLSLPALASKIRDALTLETAGRLTRNGKEDLLVVRGQLDGPSALSALPVGGNDGALRLGQIAQVYEGHADRTSLVTAMGEPAVGVNIGRRYGADAVALSKALGKLLGELTPTLPAGMRFLVTYDQADLIAPALASVRDAILLGSLLAVFILALFLRGARATLIGASALPMTLALTLLALAFAQQSLNLMTLGGLAVAIGLVVDDAVVVLEAIESKRAQGLSGGLAIRQAITEVRPAVLTSTLTAVVVLIPLAALSGVAGQFFRSLAFSLGAAVLLSLVTALIAIPLLATRLAPRPRTHEGWLPDAYRRALDASLHRPRLALGICAALVIAGALASVGLKTSFLPEMDEGSYVIDFRAPPGSSLLETDTLSRGIDRVLLASPFVRAFSRRIGTEIGPPTATESYRGDVTVRLAEKDRPSFEQIADGQRAALGVSTPQLQLEFVQLMEDQLNDLEGHAEPVEVKFFGPDLDALHRVATAFTAQLSQVPGVTDLYDGDPGCAPQIDARVDALAATRTGLDSRQIADELRIGLAGEVVGAQPYLDRLLPVRLRQPDWARFARDVPEDLTVARSNGERIPLKSLARVTEHCPRAAVLSENLRRMVAVTGRLRGSDLGSVSKTARAKLAALALPPGSWWELGGQIASQGNAFAEILRAFVLASLGLLICLTLHFGTLRLSFMLLLAVPVALACGALSLFVTGLPLNISSCLGGVVLAGLVVKNGVLLLDAAERERKDGKEPAEALRVAALTRLRPIAMTTCATLLGLLPLALGLGAGADIQRPLAVVVLGGLGLSSLITLFAIPSLYLLAHRREAPAQRAR